MNIKAAILLVTLMALMASSPATSSDVNSRKITKGIERPQPNCIPAGQQGCGGWGSESCCDGSSCLFGVCAEERKCVPEGNSCRDFLQFCCEGFNCVSGTCKSTCIPEGQSCGPFKYCCGDTSCFGGTCHPPKPCITEGNACGFGYLCCGNLYCDGIIRGITDGHCRSPGGLAAILSAVE